MTQTYMAKRIEHTLVKQDMAGIHQIRYQVLIHIAFLEDVFHANHRADLVVARRRDGARGTGTDR